MLNMQGTSAVTSVTWEAGYIRISVKDNILASNLGLALAKTSMLYLGVGCEGQ